VPSALKGSIVGIDLGTTHSAMARVEVRGEGGAKARKVLDEPVLQLVAAGETAVRPMLPSFLYIAGQHDLPESALRLPWGGNSDRRIVGELARSHGALIPTRLISSAKSWLCHPHVDRRAPILPWGQRPGEMDEATEMTRLSPVDASAVYLSHLASHFHHATGRPLADAELILGVPASFDEVARELTLEAAGKVGLRPILLEEPQAAFYAWLADHPGTWRTELHSGDLVLVVDIGGGTSDFSLITVKGAQAQAPIFERTAVGDHLLLGGDNMDLALARRVEGRLLKNGPRLEAPTFQALVQACRMAKERLLSDGTKSSWNVTVAGRGSRLVGGALRDELSRAEVEALVLDGFFPHAPKDASPMRGRTGLQEFGLPYAADAAVTRHLAAFLARHNAQPTAVLWNGGVLRSTAIRRRILEVLTSWSGTPPRVLENRDPDLAVARGAAYYGLVRRGEGLRISGGAARAYFLGVDTENVTPGQVTALCVTPRGLEEGSSVELTEHALELLTNRPVRFRLFSSSNRTGDQVGELVTVPIGSLAELPPLYTVVRFARSSQDAALSVHLHARLTELGTLELECVARATGNENDRWRLEFDLRSADAPSPRSPGAGTPSMPEFDPAALGRAKALLEALFGRVAAGDAAASPAGVMKALQTILGPKESWSMTLLRALFEPLKELRGGRGRSGEHEARWLNLVGFTLRPGFGYALDDWRVKEAWRLFGPGLLHEKDDRCRLEWWILWRRVSGGLTRTQQDELYKRLAPHFLDTFAKRADRKPPAPQEVAEMWRVLASLERLPAKQKAALGDVLLGQIEKKKAPEHALWALGRFGARVPLYGHAEDVVPIKRAERWLERLLALEWKTEHFPLAAAEIGRCSGDRARDLDEAIRRRLAERLRLLPDGERLGALVLIPTPREAREERLAFGDSLPSGLRLRSAELG
jgi:molecular chaperone DnaK (HSP70)